MRSYACTLCLGCFEWSVYILQAEVKSLRCENQLLRSGDQGLSDIKERTTYVAEQLSSATKTAESSLKYVREINPYPGL